MEFVISSADQLVEIILSGIFSLVANLFLYILLGLVLAIISMIFVNRKKWFKRKNKLWNFITNFHYLFIIAAFFVTAPMLGVSRFSHSMANDLVSDYLKPTVQSQIGVVKDQLLEYWPEEMASMNQSIEQTIDQLMNSVRYTADEDEYFAEEKTELVNWLVEDLGREVISYTLTEMIEFSSESSGIDFSSDDINVSMSQIKNTNYDLVSESIARSVEYSTNRYIDNYFILQYLGILILFLTILAAPIIETLLYYWIFKRKNNKNYSAI